MSRDQSLREECVRAGVVELFDQIVASGETAQWAAMCAMRTPPGSRYTERAFLQDMNSGVDKMNHIIRDHTYKAAHKAGISTQGKVHKPGLGPATDPGAWVSSMDDVLAVAKARNLTVTGAVNHKGVEILEKPNKPRLAPDLVKRYRKEYLKSDPSLAEKVRKSKKASRELNERIIANHARPK